MRSNDHIKKLTLSAAVCALTFAATFISVPAPFFGNVNVGDSVLLLGVWLLGGPWSIVAAAVGAALCDLTGAYAVYAPATLIIKAGMAAIALLIKKLTSHRSLPLQRILSGLGAEAVMILGYFLYEAFFLQLGVEAAMLNAPFNCVQGTVSIAAFYVIHALLSKHKMN